MWATVGLIVVGLLVTSTLSQEITDGNATYVVAKGITKCKSRDTVLETNDTDIFEDEIQTTMCPEAPQIRYLVDEGASPGTNFYLFIAGSFIVWLLGWLFVSKYTVDSGYIDIPRSVESKTINQRRLICCCIVFLELPQLLAVSFNSVMENVYSPEMRQMRNVFRYWLLRFDDSSQSGMFAFVVLVVWGLMILVYLPLVVALFAPSLYAAIAKRATGRFVTLAEWGRDFYLFYLPIPVFINLLKPFFCTEYAPPPAGFGESSTTSWNKEITCWGDEHRVILIVSSLTFIFYYLTCLAAGMVPVLVAKATDLVTNGRYTAMSIQCKVWIAGLFCLCETRYQWAHLLTVFAGLIFLTLFSISMRPCSVERINFYRSSCLSISVWVCIANVFVGVLDDPTANSPFRLALVGSCLLAMVIAFRYYVVPDNRIFPPIPVENGTYEGAVSLATLLRHGYGTQSWSDGAEYVGSFFFGTIAGRGVLRLANQMYYEGQWSDGKRHGFGKTNMIQDAEVKEYEGYFYQDEYEGFGKKTFLDEETYEGEWKGGKEHGIGLWRFSDGSTVYGDWEHGEIRLPDKRHETDASTIQGSMRYGVLHGTGARTYADGGKYDGQFACGIRHGEGRMLWPDGSTYHGGWVNDLQHGDGQFESPDGTNYEGDWLNGKMDGYGIYISSSGEVYEGNFKSGERKGYGKCGYEGGSKFIEYTGSWGKGTFTGKGTMEYSNGDKYEGPWLRGLRDGNPGIYYFADGSWYEGDWAYDDKNGEGIMYLSNVGQYTGTFTDSKRDGQGKFEWHDGSLYDGCWSDNCMHGQGTLSFRSDILISAIKDACSDYVPVSDICKEVRVGSANENKSTTSSGHTNLPGFIEDDNDDAAVGPESDLQEEEQEMHEIIPNEPQVEAEGEAEAEVEVEVNPRSTDAVPVLANITGGRYEGTWNKGEMHGTGKIVFADGSVFEGDWRHNRPQGKGTRVYASGEIYRGEWFDGRRQGIGELEYTDKRKFTGQWLNDLRHGAGKLYHSKDRTIRGYWKHDVFAGNTLEDFKTVEIQNQNKTLKQPRIVTDIPLTDYAPSIPPTLPDEEEMIRETEGFGTVAVTPPLIHQPEQQLQQTPKVDTALLDPLVPDNTSSCAEVPIESPSPSTTPSNLGKRLNVWKSTFFETHGRQPTKKDIRKDPEIASLYAEYSKGDGKKKKKKTRKRTGDKPADSTGLNVMREDEDDSDM